MSLSPGDRLDRYEVIEFLGSGGMGEVYRARDPKLEREVALKILRFDHGLGAAGAARLLREARLAAGLSHPNVLAVYDVSEALDPEPSRGLPYIAMELVRGRSLRSYFGDEMVSLERRIGWLRDIAHALGAAHKVGVVHRDVKAENIMIRDDGVVKVLDFGIARRTATTVDPWSSTEGHNLPTTDTVHPRTNVPTQARPGSLIGTPFYMSPEQLRGEEIDARADQFAWGVVAYWLLTGKPPWQVGATTLVLVSQILSSKPPAPNEEKPPVPPSVSSAIMRALAKDREARFPSMGAIVDAMDGPGRSARTPLPEGPPLQAVVGDRFEILGVAGSGGAGIVYRAHDRSLGRPVALKVLQDRDPVLLGRFAQEVEVLPALDHPHIVGYISQGVTENGAPYVVTPWFEGTDLESRLRAGPLTIEQTLAIARSVADALAYLHGRGLIHCDIKPSNLYLPSGDAARVLLGDLGIRRRSAPSLAITESGVLMGTPNFIAPEQARGDARIAPAVDIFALGCVLYECLTGKRLFTGAHPMSILAKILLEDAPRVSELRPEVPAFLNALVSRMVAKDPGERPADGVELKSLSDRGRAPIPALEALTANERRVVTVLVVAMPSLQGSIGPHETLLPDGGELFDSAAKHFGVCAQVIGDSTAIVLAPERLGAADQASLLTRFARHLVEAQPRARFVLTTGSATTTGSLPVGQAIDRAVALVRSEEVGQGVLVDDATAALIKGRFDVCDGRVRNERFSLDPTRPLLGKPTSCVGRERELAILEATFAEAAHGAGPKVLLVTAEAGTGKSRLWHEFERRLRAEAPAVQVLQCRGDPFHVSVPYAMTAQVLRQATGLGEQEQPDHAKEKLFAHVASRVPAPEVARVCDFIGELVGVHYDDRGRLPLRAARQDAAAMADQVGRAFEDLLRAWCATHPVVIVLEDLHWAHSTCVRLLDRALWKLPGAKLFVLALARPEVHGRFPALFAKRDLTEVRLPPIPRRASAKLIQEVLGSRISAEDADQIIERSEGNGFYLEELIRAGTAPAVAAGQSRPPRGDLPAAVLAVAQARLERLDPDARRVLRAASVFGEVFWVEGVSALVGEHPTTIVPIVARLVEHEAVAPTEQPRFAGVSEFAFRHALLRATAYAALTDEDRRLGHRLAAGWLRDVHEDRELVARHWLEGGDTGNAVASFRAAAELRRRRAQTEATARSSMRALLIVGAESADAVPPCVALLADALAATRQIDPEDVIAGLEGHVSGSDISAQDAGRAMVRAALNRVLDVLREAKHWGLVATLASAAHAVGALADFATAKSFLDEATFRAAGDAAALRVIRHASARVAYWSMNAAAIIELLAESALPDEPRERRQSLLMLAWAVVTVGDRAALARGLELIRQAESTRLSVFDGDTVADSEDPVARVECAKAKQVCFAFAGEHALSAGAAEEAAALARRAGLRFEECAQLHNAAAAYCLSGDDERSRARLLESSALARDIGADRIEHHNEMILARLDRDAGGLARIAQAMTDAGDPALDFFAHYRLGLLLAETRDPAARPPLERALRIARDLGIQHMVDDCARALADLDGPAPPPVVPR